MTTESFSLQVDSRPTQDDGNMADQFAIALADQIDCALLVCDSDSRLLHANLAGHRVIASCTVLAMVGDRIQCTSPSQQEWCKAVHNAAVNHRCRLFWIGKSGERTMVIAMPIVIKRLRISTAVMMLSRRSVCSKLGVELLATLHELTFAERRVFTALLNNASPRKIAATHGVTIATIRMQIQAIRNKLGVRSIDALLLRAAEVPPVTSRH
ncbi:MAG: helix-turn-helix transcriptional regulator [Burkholderiaceae bacterium]